MEDKALLAEQLQKKWQPVLEHPELPSITDSYRKNVTTILLENEEQALMEDTPTNVMGVGGSPHLGQAGNVKTFDPVMISLVRRSMPNLMAYDICGVQPMTGPTGLIFAMRSRYTSGSGTEAFYNEADSDFGGSAAADGPAGGSGAGVGAHGGTDPLSGTDIGGTNYLMGIGMNTAEGEGKTPAEMGFSIERVAVEARTRALKAEYSIELAQDLKAVHGLDAEAELANILSSEILAEVNREVVRTIYQQAKLGCAQSDLLVSGGGYTVDGVEAGGTATAGIYDLLKDSDGRWSAEKFRGLMFQIEREANVIAKETRRGKGNIVICSADVASALSMSGILNHDPAFGNLTVDDTGNTFVGTLNGRTKVYVDPYASTSFDFVCVGYRGESQYDAGLFYCPYVPLQMVRAVDADSFQPRIGFKTRYGMVANPFASGTASGVDGLRARRENQYYRIFRVQNLHGINANATSAGT